MVNTGTQTRCSKVAPKKKEKKEKKKTEDVEKKKEEEGKKRQGLPLLTGLNHP